MHTSSELPSESIHTINSSEPDVEIPSTQTQLQIDPSTLGQVLAGAIQLAQSGVSTSVPNPSEPTRNMPRTHKKKTTVTKPRQSKQNKQKKNSPTNSPKKTPPKKTPTKSNSNKKKSNKKKEDEEDDSRVKRKTTIQWARDDNGDGKSSMYLLLNWLSEEDNFQRFKDKGSYKRNVAEEIQQYFIDNGITWRNAHAIQSKVEILESQWRNANQVRNGTGGGVCDAALELKRQKEWDDDSAEWVREKKVAFGPILKECKYYFELEPIFASRHGNTRLSVAHNIAHETEDEDEFHPEREHERDPLEHSPNSNSAYHDLQDNSQCNPLDHSLNSNLAHEENDHNDSDDLLEKLGEMFDEDELIKSRSPSVCLTQTRFRGATTTSTPLKRTASKISLQSNLESSNGKRHKKGSASKIQELVLSQKLGRGGRASASVEPNNHIKEDDIISRQEVKIDRICNMADNLANMFPQAPKPVLDEIQEKQKAKIELETAEVVLKGEKKKLDLYDFDLSVKRDHHELEMEAKRSELEHQKTARHAQLISMLMKENNLTLHEAVSAAQSAAGMVNQ